MSSRLVARIALLVALLGVCVLGRRGALRSLDERLWDRLQRKLPAPDPALPVTLVAIDDATLEALKVPSVGRAEYTRVLPRLKQLGARAVVCDVFFEKPKDPAGDARLGDALRTSRALVPFELSWTRSLEGGSLRSTFAPRRPPASIGVDGEQQGFANLPVKENLDGVYRRVWLERRAGQRVYEALGLRLARMLGMEGEVEPDRVVRLDYRALRRPEAYRTLSFHQLLEADVDAALVRDRVCFVGATAARLGDIKDTPLGPRPGALVHATVAENLLGGRLVGTPGGVGAILLGLPVLAAGLALGPELWLVAGLGWAMASLLLTILAALTGFFLPSGGALLASLALLLCGLGFLLAPAREGSRRRWTVEQAREAMEKAVEEGDLRQVRLLYAAFEPAVQADPRVLADYALGLLGDGRDGLLEKVLSRHEDWDVPMEQRDRLARELEAEGFVELALEQLEYLYRRDATWGDVGERLFRLRSERDERWGVLSPRAVRDLLGWEFRHLAPLAEGGEALVFRGTDRETGRRAVIKVLHPRHLEDPEFLGRFQNEARALQEVEAAAVPEVLRVERGRLPFLALARRDGRPPEAGAPEPRRRRWMTRLASALQAVHAAGWVHRDLHPGNLLVDDEDAVTLLDFGLAAPVGGEGPAGGTPGFVSPDQAAGAPAETAQDVFSLGQVAKRLGDWDPELEALWERCVSVSPGARPDLGEVLEVLRS